MKDMQIRNAGTSVWRLDGTQENTFVLEVDLGGECVSWRQCRGDQHAAHTPAPAMSPLPPVSAMSPVPEDGQPQPQPGPAAGRRSRRSSTVSCSGRRSRLGSESAGEGGVGDRVQVGCI